MSVECRVGHVRDKAYGAFGRISFGFKAYVGYVYVARGGSAERQTAYVDMTGDVVDPGSFEIHVGGKRCYVAYG